MSVFVFGSSSLYTFLHPKCFCLPLINCIQVRILDRTYYVHLCIYLYSVGVDYFTLFYQIINKEVRMYVLCMYSVFINVHTF